jgi:hypothetical protein
VKPDRDKSPAFMAAPLKKSRITCDEILYQFGGNRRALAGNPQRSMRIGHATVAYRIRLGDAGADDFIPVRRACRFAVRAPGPPVCRRMFSVELTEPIGEAAERDRHADAKFGGLENDEDRA